MKGNTAIWSGTGGKKRHIFKSEKMTCLGGWQVDEIRR